MGGDRRRQDKNKEKKKDAKRAALDARADVLPGVARKWEAVEVQLGCARDRLKRTAALAADALCALTDPADVFGRSSVHSMRRQLGYEIQRARLAVGRAGAMLKRGADESGAVAEAARRMSCAAAAQYDRAIAAALQQLRKLGAERASYGPDVSAIAEATGCKVPATVSAFGRRRRALRHALSHAKRCAAAAAAAASDGMMRSVAAHTAESAAAGASTAEAGAMAVSAASTWAVGAAACMRAAQAEDASLRALLARPCMATAVDAASPGRVVATKRTCVPHVLGANDPALVKQTFYGWEVVDREALEGGDYTPPGGYADNEKPAGPTCSCKIAAARIPERVREELGLLSREGFVTLQALSVAGPIARRFFNMQPPHKQLKTLEVHRQPLCQNRRGKWLCVRVGNFKSQQCGSAAIGFVKLVAGSEMEADNLSELSKDPRVCASLTELRWISRNSKAPKPAE
jgi:hypothetical protein